MKKILFITFILLFSFFVSSCDNYLKDAQQTNPKQTNDLLEENKFNDVEIEEAKKVVLKQFEKTLGEDCKLIKLYYSNEDYRSKQMVKLFLKNGGGIGSDIKKENIIIFYCDFKVKAKPKNGGLKANDICTGFSWLLIRDNQFGKWKVASSGY